MEYREIKAPTYKDAIDQIKKEYGNRARIIKKTDETEGGFLGIGKKRYVKVTISITENDLLDNYRKNLGISKLHKENEEENKIDINKFTPREESLTMSLLMEKINNIEKVIQKNNVETKREDTNSNIYELKEILKENEFSDDFINNTVKNIQDNLSLSKIEDRNELHNYVYDLIKNKLIFDNSFKQIDDRKKVLVLVGPTGIGKTTTITKIAAMSLIKEKIKVELITIDGFRLGAVYQLQNYADIMKVPFNTAEDRMELQKQIDLSDASLVLVDTIGRSQKDELNIVKMKQVLEIRNANVEFVLVISATIKAREVERVFKSFDLFDFKNVIITKLDESETMGAILSEIILRNKGIMYLTNGQRVPNDIEKANAFNIMSKIKGLDIEVHLKNTVY